MDERSFTEEDVTLTVAAMRQNEEVLYFELGVALQYLYAPPNVAYSAPYEKMGKELWVALQVELYDLICRPKSKTPRTWVQELISGDIRNLAVAVLTAIVAKASLPLSIAVPAAALVLKHGAVKYCQAGRPVRPERTVAEILTQKQKEMSTVHKKTKK